MQQATWALPLHPATDATIDRVLALVERAEGDALVFTARPRDQAMAGRIEDSFLEGREAEWQEFVRECDQFDAEIDHEIVSEKFTPAELDANFDYLKTEDYATGIDAFLNKKKPTFKGT